MNAQDFNHNIELLVKERKSLLDDLFFGDNILNVEKIDKKIIEIKKDFFVDTMGWKLLHLRISDNQSISPSWKELFYTPFKFNFLLEYDYSDCTFSVNNFKMEFLNNNSFVIEEKLLQTLNIKNINKIEVNFDNSFLYIFINSLEVLKIIKPSESFYLSLH